MSEKRWKKEDKDRKLKELKLKKKRKHPSDCTPEEYELFYGHLDWTKLKAKQEE